jgi:hypothetical protein
MSSATTLNNMTVRLTPEQIAELQLVAEAHIRENIMKTIALLTGENLMLLDDLATRLYCEYQVKVTDYSNNEEEDVDEPSN